MQGPPPTSPDTVPETSVPDNVCMVPLGLPPCCCEFGSVTWFVERVDIFHKPVFLRLYFTENHPSVIVTDPVALALTVDKMHRLTVQSDDENKFQMRVYLEGSTIDLASAARLLINRCDFK